MVVGPAGPVVDAVVVSPAEPRPEPAQTAAPADPENAPSDAEPETGVMAAVAAIVTSPVVALATPVARVLRGRRRGAE